MRLWSYIPDRAEVLIRGLSTDLSAIARALRTDRRPLSESRHSVEELRRFTEEAAQVAREQAEGCDAYGGSLELEVVSIERTTSDSVTLFMRKPSSDFAFTPGQFLTISISIGAQTLRRAYSLCSAPHDELLAISCKRVVDGRVSNFINDNIAVGDTLRASGPSGRFGTMPRAGQSRHVALIAGGSGITPLLSIARTVLAEEPESRVTLIYANKSVASVMHAADLASLRSERDAFSVRFLLENTEGAETLCGPSNAGRLSQSVVDELCAEKPDEIYLCGPEGMLSAAQEHLASAGVAEERVHLERFFDQSGKGSGRHAAALPYEVHVAGSGESFTVPPGQTILRAATDAGVALSFSCTMGGCASCKLRLLSGDVQLETPNCLSREEEEDGMILTCVAYPHSDIEISVEQQ